LCEKFIESYDKTANALPFLWAKIVGKGIGKGMVMITRPKTDTRANISAYQAGHAPLALTHVLVAGIILGRGATEILRIRNGVRAVNWVGNCWENG